MHRVRGHLKICGMTMAKLALLLAKRQLKNISKILTIARLIIFYYSNYDNPVTINYQQYLLVGIVSLKQKRRSFLGKKSHNGLPVNGDFVWS